MFSMHLVALHGRRRASEAARLRLFVTFTTALISISAITLSTPDDYIRPEPNSRSPDANDGGGVSSRGFLFQNSAFSETSTPTPPTSKATSAEVSSFAKNLFAGGTGHVGNEADDARAAAEMKKVLTRASTGDKSNAATIAKAHADVGGMTIASSIGVPAARIETIEDTDAIAQKISDGEKAGNVTVDAATPGHAFPTVAVDDTHALNRTTIGLATAAVLRNNSSGTQQGSVADVAADALKASPAVGVNKNSSMTQVGANASGTQMETPSAASTSRKSVSTASVDSNASAASTHSPLSLTGRATSRASNATVVAEERVSEHVGFAKSMPSRLANVAGTEDLGSKDEISRAVAVAKAIAENIMNRSFANRTNSTETTVQKVPEAIGGNNTTAGTRVTAESSAGYPDNGTSSREIGEMPAVEARKIREVAQTTRARVIDKGASAKDVPTADDIVAQISRVITPANALVAALTGSISSSLHAMNVTDVERFSEQKPNSTSVTTTFAIATVLDANSTAASTNRTVDAIMRATGGNASVVSAVVASTTNTAVADTNVSIQSTLTQGINRSSTTADGKTGAVALAAPMRNVSTGMFTDNATEVTIAFADFRDSNISVGTPVPITESKASADEGTANDSGPVVVTTDAGPGGSSTLAAKKLSDAVIHVLASNANYTALTRHESAFAVEYRNISNGTRSDNFSVEDVILARAASEANHARSMTRATSATGATASVEKRETHENVPKASLRGIPRDKAVADGNDSVPLVLGVDNAASNAGGSTVHLEEHREDNPLLRFLDRVDKTARLGADSLLRVGVRATASDDSGQGRQPTSGYFGLVIVVVPILFVIPAIALFIYFVVFRDAAMERDLEDRIVQIESLASIVQDLSHRVRMQIEDLVNKQVDWSQHDFLHKKNDFVAFLEFCQDSPEKLGGPAADDGLGDALIAFAKIWLQMFHDVSRCPRTEPNVVIPSSELERCPEGLVAASAWFATRLVDVDVHLINVGATSGKLVKQQQERMRRGSAWMATPMPQQSERQAGSYEVLLSKSRKVIANGSMCNWVNICGFNRSYEAISAGDLGHHHSFPRELMCCCWIFRMNIFSPAHCGLLIYWILLFPLGYYCLIVPYYIGLFLIFLAWLMTTMLLFVFEKLDMVARLQSSEFLLIKEKEEAQRLHKDLDVFYAKVDSVSDVWACRTRPRLDIMKQTMRKLMETRWPSMEACKEFWTTLNKSLSQMERSVGHIDDYFHDPDCRGKKRYGKEAMALLRAQMEKASNFVRLNDAKEVTRKAAAGLFCIPNLLGVRVVRCRGLPKGTWADDYDPYVKMRARREGTWVRTETRQNEQNPEWHTDDDPVEFRFQLDGFGRELECEIMDENTIGEDTFMGQVRMKIDDMICGAWTKVVTTISEPIDRTKPGELEIDVFLCRSSSDILALMPLTDEEEEQDELGEAISSSTGS